GTIGATDTELRAGPRRWACARPPPFGSYQSARAEEVTDVGPCVAREHRPGAIEPLVKPRQGGPSAASASTRRPRIPRIADGRARPHRPRHDPPVPGRPGTADRDRRGSDTA